MRIYNTLTRSKEELSPRDGKVGIYACGPTVYNFIHIGNARPICVFDVLRRYLEYKGLKVTYVQNFTDIDDKIIRKANEEGKTYDEIANTYIAEYKTDAAGLNVREADIHPLATENMEQIIEFVQTLVDRGHAYESNGDVYFRTHTFDGYGKLSHMPLEDLEAGARIDISEQKENPMDFALWKKAKEGEPSWDSPFSKGRPGWHIECSTMAKRYLGETIDIHCGGQDLIFPHHENEIAQSECANGCEFARFWMHNGYINVDNRKMSKSLGNFFTVREIAARYGYEPIRFMMIAAHYRSPINFSQEVIEQSKASLERLYSCRENLDIVLSKAGDAAGTDEAEAKALFDSRVKQFDDALADDLNTADALAAVFELVRDINTHVSLSTNPSKALCQSAIDTLETLCGVLGLLYNYRRDDVGEEIKELVKERQEARKARDFARADAIRDELAQKGYAVEDTAQGPVVKRLS